MVCKALPIRSLVRVHPAEHHIAATLRLALVPGIGPQLWKQLLAHFRTPQAVLAASPQELRQIQGIGIQTSQAILAAGLDRSAEEMLAVCQQHGIEVLTESETSYPQSLREIPAPPSLLFLSGSLRPCDTLAVAIVGTRRVTNYGRCQAQRFAAELSRAGLTIVSGLARGVDATAHQAAIDAGGRTIAVMGSGLLHIYPPEHRSLARRIQDCGALLTEFPPHQKPSRSTFPQRNRIISGLCLGVLVVEAPAKSGALISAQHALEQGRDVFAIPGPVNQKNSRGCHQLLRDGATLVETPRDVLDELGPLCKEIPQSDGRVIRHPAELSLNTQEQAVLNAIPTTPTHIDTVITESQLAPNQVLSTISALEIRQLVRRLAGQQVVRN